VRSESQALKPIQTSYAGYRFRSRLEARWAVFFDTLEIPWEYEVQGYEVDGRPYLPDFELRPWTESGYGDRVLVEVKGDPDRLDKSLLAATVRTTGQPVLILGPIPEPAEYGGKPYVHRIILPLSDCCECAGACPSWEAAAFHAPHPSDRRTLSIWSIGSVFGKRWPAARAHRTVEDAYASARSARFEHGETPDRWKLA
jgi:hypothetical protein